MRNKKYAIVRFITVIKTKHLFCHFRTNAWTGSKKEIRDISFILKLANSDLLTVLIYQFNIRNYVVQCIFFRDLYITKYRKAFLFLPARYEYRKNTQNINQ